MAPFAQTLVRRRSRAQMATLGVLLLFVLILALLWSQRRDIAIDYIDRELVRRGVQARYEIKRLGVGTQRLENVVIGDPARPDLIARSVEIKLSYGLRAPRLHRITARGVRLFGRIEGGKLSLGQIDKLLPPPTGAPFSLPEIIADLDDTAMALDTPSGRIGLAIKGVGKLSDGFDGRIAAAARGLDFGGCRLGRSTALIDVRISDRRPQLDGPVRSAAFACGDKLEFRDLVVNLDTELTPALDGWDGKAGIRSARARTAGGAAAGVAGTLSFAGTMERTRGRLDMAAAGTRFGALSTGRLRLDGSYDLADRGSRFALVGDAAVADAVAGEATLRPVSTPLRALGGTPIEPIGEAIAAALDRAGRGAQVRGRLVVAVLPRLTAFRLQSLAANSHSGARVTLSNGRGLSVDVTRGLFVLDGRLALAGGGFPSIDAVLEQQSGGGPMQGKARIAPFAAGGARLAMTDIAFGPGPAGSTRLSTVATIDGPLDDGSVQGLVVPVTGRFGKGGFAFGEGCTPLSFQALRYSSLRLGPTRLPLCPFGPALLWQDGRGQVRGGGDIARLRLAGRLGSSPIQVAAERFRVGVDEPGFASSRTAIRLGNTGYVNRLDLASLSGRFTARGIDGRFAGAAGKIANVPLLLSNASGRWQVVGGKALVNGAITVSDEATQPRFYPLASKDFRLTLIGNRIHAEAGLDDPQTGTRVIQADIVHALDSGRGRAALDVPGITFTEGFQPEELTRLTTGVVALVNGTLTGNAEIAWGPGGTTSTGTFSTRDMAFAASFGPLTGLSTTVHFTDLLGLATAPGQLAEVGKIQTGIDVFDGKIRYQLLPGLRVKVEEGRWPFAGGELVLEETMLDFSRQSAKHLTFRVIGMDAATFVERMEFSNIAATGTFDGVVPMVFDERGGRIAGGHLEARQGGGVVSYVGELTDRQLGTYGKMAFDALKSLRYDRLVIVLNGSLEGEFVASIELDGIARNAPSPGGIAGAAIKQLAKIPFEFNITARGPFRALIATARSFNDPTPLIQSVLPSELRDQPTSTNVQRDESETVQ